MSQYNLSREVLDLLKCNEGSLRELKEFTSLYKWGLIEDAWG